MIKELLNRFKHGRMSADSEQRSRKPSTSRNADVIEKVRTLIMEDRRLAIREVADEVGTSRGQTVNKEYCKRPELWDARNWQLHDDNAPAHSSHLIQGFLAKHGIPQVRQAPYSPDMAPCDFWLFPRLKTPLKAAVFTAARASYRTRRCSCTPFQKKAFQSCFQRWKDRWAKCVKSQGAYFVDD
ncbi:hypothetical protein B7P43_G08390 [Cryptotermes secundus]|uniref:Tc1-like transposase DDE domain-containing protein n=1 Tax=Cryptotermes secundus TaxID=105785 RepID=A0A2J7R7V3_9NEOP|nr:hypothetical protein B7P43_G08390 [Cryptotermes secundus]